MEGASTTDNASLVDSITQTYLGYAKVLTQRVFWTGMEDNPPTRSQQRKNK